jgi:hypothetical protein
MIALTKQSFWTRALATVWVTAWTAPIAAATFAVLLYEANVTPALNSLVWAIVGALVFWLVIAIAYSPMTGPHLANSRSYGLLVDRIDGLHQRQLRVCTTDNTAKGGCQQAKEGIDKASALLKEPGLQWVSERGYIAVWEKIHRAEEALMEAEEKEDLSEDVEHMALQLDGAGIPQKEALLKLLNSAKAKLAKLESKAAGRNDSVSPAPNALAGSTSEDSLSAAPKAPDDSTSNDDLSASRKALKEVRYNINVFRDNQWNGMVGQRNQTIATLLLVELVGFGLLGLALLKPAGPVAAGALYFLVGAVAGLFNRLYSESQADHAVDDYGLAMARILTLPVYAGLAGVGGVLLTSLTSAQAGVSTLSSVFEFQNRPLVLVVAAAFGLAPALLVEGLSKQGKQSASALKSTEPGQTGSTPGSGGS